MEHICEKRAAREPCYRGFQLARDCGCVAGCIRNEAVHQTLRARHDDPFGYGLHLKRSLSGVREFALVGDSRLVLGQQPTARWGAKNAQICPTIEFSGLISRLPRLPSQVHPPRLGLSFFGVAHAGRMGGCVNGRDGAGLEWRGGERSACAG